VHNMSKGILSPDGLWMWTGTEWIPAPPTSPPPMPPSMPNPAISQPVAPSTQTKQDEGYFSSNSDIDVGNYFSNSSIESQFRQNIQTIGENCHMEATCGRTGRPVDGKHATWTLESLEEIDGLYWIVGSKKQQNVSHLDGKARFVLSGPTFDDLIEGHEWDGQKWTPHFSVPGKWDGLVFDPSRTQTVGSVIPLGRGNVVPNIEREIKRNIQRIGVDCFPDDGNATWNIVDIKEKNGSYWVETRPIPDVGYERIMFVLNSPAPDGVAECHYWENGNWSLLFS